MMPDGVGLTSLFEDGEELTTVDVADRLPADVTPQDLHVALDDHPDVVKVREGETVRWRLADDDWSDMPCPLGCGFRPSTGRGAFLHLLGHAIGRHSTGEDQQERRRIAD